jgi:hypothetical protein
MEGKMSYFGITIVSMLLTQITSSEFTQANASVTYGHNYATLIVINHVLNSGIAKNITSSDFKMIVSNLNLTKNPVPKLTHIFYLINGSETGIAIQLLPGTFVIRDSQNSSTPIVAGYNTTASGDCHLTENTHVFVAAGDIHNGQSKTCFITRTIF